MKKIILPIFLLMGTFGFSQSKYDSLVKSYNDSISKNYENSESNPDGYTMSVNLNYVENDIWSGGFRVEINKIIYDFNYGSTFNGYNNIATSPLNKTTIYKVGIGKKVAKDFVLGIDYQYTEYKQKNNYYSNEQILDKKHNFGMFFNYCICKSIGINYTINTITGNSIGLSYNFDNFLEK